MLRKLHDAASTANRWPIAKIMCRVASNKEFMRFGANGVYSSLGPGLSTMYEAHFLRQNYDQILNCI